MRSALSVALCSLGLFAVAIAPAAAVPPAWDQYTEEELDPGGPGKIPEEENTNPGPEDGAGKPPADRRGRSATPGPPGGPSDTSSPDSGGATSSPTGETGDQSADGSAAGTGATDQTGRDGAVKQSSVSGSSDDLGWLFPLLLIGSAVGVGGYVMHRRGDRSTPKP